MTRGKPPSPVWPRILSLALLAVIAGLVHLESRSTLSAAIRDRTPWLVWTAIRNAENIDLFLLIYQPARRSLDIVYIPPGPPAAGAKALSSIDDPHERAQYAQAWLLRQAPSLKGRDKPGYLYLDVRRMPDFEPPAAVKVWIREEWRGMTFWKNIVSLARSGDARGALRNFDSLLTPFDLFLLALETSRLDPGKIRPAWLPEGELRPHLLTRLLAPPGNRPSPTRQIRVEVLNASGIKGFASNATKVLRLKGVDVVYYGNAKPRSQSVVYDRLGRVENALIVAERLGCPAAEAMTRVEPRSLVDVTVLLAEDCAGQDAFGK